MNENGGSALAGMIGMLKNGDPKYSKRSSYGIKKQISKLGSQSEYRRGSYLSEKSSPDNFTSKKQR